ncbi:copper ion transmembrane transporter [Corchorus capsularis]|uniref:Copper ion transmembrane transporter n=1 Tax=Corchorus capsularis TaxID=210143 RepID=A0A1R3H807_COCAP|nr:copper ion transmembrane transporter [Corchorus capsularis]
MGGKIYPGGVSRRRWLDMQDRRSKQLVKIGLARERHIYKMRKKAELKAAVSELERPWEVVKKAPNLFSVSADEQVKVLADRFQKLGGFDTVQGLPSARFFPKGVVHSVKRYTRGIDSDENAKLLSENKAEENGSESESESEIEDGNSERSGKKNGRQWKRKGVRRRLDAAGKGSFDEKRSNLKSQVYDKRSNLKSGVYDKRSNLKSGVYDKRSNLKSGVYDKRSDLKSGVYDKRSNLKSGVYDERSNLKSGIYDKRSNLKSGVYDKRSNLKSEVYDMSLQRDGSYGIRRNG